MSFLLEVEGNKIRFHFGVGETFRAGKISCSSQLLLPGCFTKYSVVENQPVPKAGPSGGILGGTGHHDSEA